MTEQTKFYVTHRDEHGERHQIGEAFEAAGPTAALDLILEQSGSEDDGDYEVFLADGDLTAIPPG
jgi:hypothetical protein